MDCPSDTGREVERQCRHTGDVGILCNVPNSTTTNEVVSYTYSFKLTLRVAAFV